MIIKLKESEAKLNPYIDKVMKKKKPGEQDVLHKKKSREELFDQFKDTVGRIDKQQSNLSLM